MINLLPVEEQKLIKKEYLRRLIVVVGIFFFVFVCISTILLLPSYFLFSSQKKSFDNQLDAIHQRLERESAADAESSISDLNEKLKSFSGSGEASQPISRLIKQILSVKPAAVKLAYIYYQQQRLSLQGQAQTRKSLLSFTGALESFDEVNKVQSPPSNLLKEENIDFNLVIYLKP